VVVLFDEEFELDVVEWFQGLGSWLDGPMGWFTQLGNPLMFVVIVAGIFWSIDSGVGKRMALFTFAAGSVNEVLKRVFSAPRPFWVSGQVESMGEGSTSFGMPSGHSLGALAWLLIAVRAQRRWVWALTGLVALLIAVSRIYRGAHFPSQVIVGLLIGAVLLWAFVRLEPTFLRWFDRFGLVQRLGFVALVSAGLLAAGWVSVQALGDGAVEAEWITNAAGQIDESKPFDPADGNDIASTVGIFAGTAAGLVLLAHVGGFDSAGTIKTRVLRFVVGFVTVAVVLAIMGVAGGALGLDDSEGAGGTVWEFISAAAIGLTIFLVAPVVFARLRLTDVSANDRPAVAATQ
jgi:membrane-associated phospholipid phosphatase